MTGQSRLQRSSALAEMIAQDRAFRGIGTAKAASLEARFGADLRMALERRDQAIAEIVGDEAAVNAFAVFEWKAAEVDVLEWLTNSGTIESVGTPTALKIARCWGSSAFS